MTGRIFPRFHGQGGPKDRRKRYDVKVTIDISTEAKQYLVLWAKLEKTAYAWLIRRAIMKDIHIHRNNRKKMGLPSLEEIEENERAKEQSTEEN